MSDEENLYTARRTLIAALADKTPMYFIKMKQWFQLKHSKEKFDADVRRLLNPEQIHCHNMFLLAMLNKVEGLGDMPPSYAHERAFSFGKNRKPKIVTASTSAACASNYEDIPRFDPVNLSDYLPPQSPQSAGPDGVKYVAQETFLPDQSLVVGRFMLAAWDHDLEGVDDEAANIVVVATQMLLKNILTAVITRCKTYKTKGYFQYDIGGHVPNMWLRNSSRSIEHVLREEMPYGELGRVRRPPTIDEIEHATAMEMACSGPKEEDPITLTLEDVYHTLLENRNLIPHHSVYSVNLERIITMLSHPSD